MRYATRITLALSIAVGLTWGCERESPKNSSPSTATNADVVPVASMDEAVLRTWADMGRKVWLAKACNMCHSLNGAPLAGPSPLGVWGSKQMLADGREVLVDEAYIRESILNPGAAITAGYTDKMISLKGNITDEELRGLAALFRSLKAVPSVPASAPTGGPR